MNIEEEFIQNWINDIAKEALTISEDDDDDDISMCMHNKLVNRLMKIEILSRTC